MADIIQYVTLGIAEEVLAVPVEQVQEILELQPMSRLPHAPAHLLGMIDVRGKGVPVIDLRLELGFEQTEDTENTRVIVLDVTVGEDKLTFGLKTDRVFEVTTLDEDDLESPPEIGVKWRSDFILGIGRRNGNFVTVLDVKRLFTANDAAMMKAIAHSRGQAA